LWNYKNGAILIIGTETTDYHTKRGIKVGDSSDKVIELYSQDCKVYEYDYEKNEYKAIVKQKSPVMFMYISNSCISINATNMLEEEIMTISFLLKDGIVSKIIIKCVE